MTNDSFMLYKLMILYMLDRVDFPLTESQISQFILDNNYTTYFNLQITIKELVEIDFIRPTQARNHSLYEITEQGKEAIEIFEFKISDPIKLDILKYLKEQKIEQFLPTTILLTMNILHNAVSRNVTRHCWKSKLQFRRRNRQFTYAIPGKKKMKRSINIL